MYSVSEFPSSELFDVIILYHDLWISYSKFFVRSI